MLSIKDSQTRQRESYAAATGSSANYATISSENRVELAVLYEEITLLKEQLAHANTAEGRKMKEKSATFDDLKAMDPSNLARPREVGDPNQPLNASEAKEQLAKKSNLLEEAAKREEKLQDHVHDLKNALKRLQKASQSQKAYSDKFIEDLKRENRMLLESLSKK